MSIAEMDRQSRDEVEICQQYSIGYAIWRNDVETVASISGPRKIQRMLGVPAVPYWQQFKSHELQNCTWKLRPDGQKEEARIQEGTQ